MRDPHQNLFFYYRGPTKKGKNGSFDRQIENNTTKSLINTLEFLNSNNFPYLQNKILELVNSRSKKVVSYKLQEWKVDSIPDVKIKLENSSIYIEVKVNAPIGEGQLENHLKALEPDDQLIVLTNRLSIEDRKKIKNFQNKKIQHLTWDRVHRICCETESRFRGKRKFKVQIEFLNQFIKYLEMVVMTDFAGFRDEDFDYFLDYNQFYRATLENKLEAFAKRIKESMPSKLRRQYSELYLGNIKKINNQSERTAWFAIRKKQVKKDLLKHCNFTIEISPSEMSINAVIRDGRIFDREARVKKNTPVGIFYQILEEKKEILNVLKNVKPGIFFVIYERTGRDGKPPGRYTGDNWTKYFTIDSKYIKSKDDIKMFQHALKMVEYPGIHVKKVISRFEEILSKPDALVKNVAYTFEGLSPFLKILESHVAHK